MGEKGKENKGRGEWREMGDSEGGKEREGKKRRQTERRVEKRRRTEREKGGGGKDLDTQASL